MPEIEPPEPTRFGEVVWLEPYPDALLEGAIDGPLGPEARYEQTEAMSLAFVTALQVLPASPARRTDPARGARLPRRRGGRDARLDRGLGQQRAQARPRRPAAPPADRRALGPGAELTRRAGARGEVRPRVRAPATSTRWLRCSPTTSVCPCRRCPSSTAAATPWPVSTPASSADRRYDLVPTRANGQVAFGTYLYAPTDGIRHGTGLARPHPHRRPDLRDDPLRQQCPSVVRPAAITAWQLTRDAAARELVPRQAALGR